MKVIVKKTLLFIFGCILVRSLLVLLSYKINKKYLPILGYLGILSGLGFIMVYLTDSNKRGATFDQKAWWNILRPIHGIIYILFGYLAINKNSKAYKVLIADVLLGLVSFISYHFIL